MTTNNGGDQNTQKKSSTAAKDMAKKTLNKYRTEQLIAKLDSNGVFGASKDAAIEILKERKVDVSKYELKDSTKTNVKYTGKALVDAEGEVVLPTKAQAPAKAAAAAKVPAVKKEKAEKKEMVKIDLKDPKVAKILENKEFSKSDKIRALLGLSYTVSQVAKKYFPKLDAHYSFVFGVKQRMDAEAVGGGKVEKKEAAPKAEPKKADKKVEKKVVKPAAKKADKKPVTKKK